MTTYDVLVGPVAGLAGYRSKRFRVEDGNAPAWTEGKLITPVFKEHYELNDSGRPTGNVERVTVTAWIEEDGATLRIGSAMQQAEDNPGRRGTA